MNSELALRPDPGGISTSMGYGAAPTDEGGLEIDLRQIISAIYRNRYIVIATLGLALVLGVVVTILSTRVYSAAATVQIEQQTSDILGKGGDQTLSSGQDSDRFLQTEVDIIKSRAVAERVAESLNLYANDDFIIAMGGKPAPASVRNSALARREAVIKILMAGLNVSLPRTSRIVSIGFDSPNPGVAQRVANAYAQNFITANLQRRFDASSYARSFLEQQLGLAKTRLERSERAMIAYARQAGLLDTSNAMSSASGDDGSGSAGIKSLTTSDLVQINNAYIAARATRIDAEQRWQQAQATPMMSLPEVLGSPAVQALMQQRAGLQAAYDQDLQRRKPDFPTMKQNFAQIQALNNEINLLGGHLRDAIRDQYQTALKQEKSLQGSVAQLKGATLAEQDRSVQYNILKRETDTNRSMYDALLQRYKEVSAQAGVTSNNISILDTSDMPAKPVSPRPLINMVIALFVGCALAAVIVFIRERFDDAIRSPEDATEKLGLSFLSSVPRLAADTSPMEALEDPRSAFSESYHSLRTSLRLLSSSGMPRSLLFTSSRGSEGKSTTSLAVARSFAQIGVKVLLVDGDLRKPSLNRLLGMSNTVGLSSVLARQLPCQEAILNSGIPNLDFVPAGPIPPSPTALLSGPVLSDIIRYATENYELLIIDGPPVLGIADAILYAVAVEGSVFIVEAGRNNHGAGRAALRRLIASGATIYGTVLTKFNAKDAGYGDDYGYYSYGAEDSRPALET